MCGRFIFIPSDEEKGFFDTFSINDSIEMNENYNVAPTQLTPIVTKNSPNKAQYMHWGLIPTWAKDTKFASKMINARVETITTKPSFKTLLNKNRCLVPANGYYEWSKVDGEKQPFLIGYNDHHYMAFAGLYDTWISPEGKEIHSFTIITKQADGEIAEIHHRMPLILSQTVWEKWLDPKIPYTEMENELQLVKGSDLIFYQVSKSVNSPRNNSPQLLVRVG